MTSAPLCDINASICAMSCRESLVCPLCAFSARSGKKPFPSANLPMKLRRCCGLSANWICSALSFESSTVKTKYRSFESFAISKFPFQTAVTFSPCLHWLPLEREAARLYYSGRLANARSTILLFAVIISHQSRLAPMGYIVQNHPRFVVAPKRVSSPRLAFLAGNFSLFFSGC